MLSRKFVCAGEDYSTREHHVPAPLLRRSFIVKNMPKSAVFTVCGLGFYELYVNGERITNGALAPYVNSPDDLLFYDSYDLTPKLKTGENVIGIMLGNGMLNSVGGTVWNFDRAAWRASPRAAFSLEADGKLLFEADENVKTHPSEITFDDLRIGAFCDARLKTNGWKLPRFDDSSWENAKSTASPNGTPLLRNSPPVIFKSELKPTAIEHFDSLCFCTDENNKPLENTRVNDVYVYDFGENNAGVCRLKIKGKRGQTVKLRFGEQKIDGRFSLSTTIFLRENCKFYFDYPQMDIYTCAGDGEETFTPPFTYHGFRYVLVEGITKEQATSELLTYMTVCSDNKQRGTFTTSDEILSRFTDMALRSDRSNFVFFPTDCPHREKNGWTGDAQLSAEQMQLYMNCDMSYREWMRNIAKSQNADGAVPGIVPTAGWGFEWGNGPAWDAVITEIPINCLRFDGDTEIIRENRDLILNYIRYIRTRTNADGLVAVGLGDWCQPLQEGYDDSIRAPLEVTDTAYVYKIASDAARLFEAIGDSAAQNEACTLADEIRAAFREKLIDKETLTVKGNCLTSQVIALAFGLFEEAEHERALSVLLDIIEKDDYRLVCGIFGTRFIFNVLCDGGYADLAHRLLTEKRDYPSFMQIFDEDATTMFEAYTKDGKMSDSRNHHFRCDILSFFMQRIAGLRPNPYTRDVNEYLVAPNFISKLNDAAATFEAVSVSWKRTEDGITLSVAAPQNVHGRIKLPKDCTFADGTSEKELLSGTYFVKEA